MLPREIHGHAAGVGQVCSIRGDEIVVIIELQHGPLAPLPRLKDIDVVVRCPARLRPVCVIRFAGQPSFVIVKGLVAREVEYTHRVVATVGHV